MSRTERSLREVVARNRKTRERREKQNRRLHLESLESRRLMTLTPQFVFDINSSGSSGSNPTGLVEMGGYVYFAATTPSAGTELWKSDGTAANTVIVKDINSGNSPSNPQNLTVVNGSLFFSADNGTNGVELWKSDGTANGTVLVKDIHSGSHSSTPASLTNVNGTLFFSADDGSNGTELWKSNGLSNGTVLVKDIREGSNSSNLTNLTAVNGTLFFSAETSSNGAELWKSDGSSGGTTIVKNIRSGGGSSPSSLTNVNGTLFFSANDGSTGVELWKTDGTSANTVIVKNINTGSSAGGSSTPANLTNVNGTLFFSANDGSTGAELWKSDGTLANTVIVKNINTGSSGSASSTPANLTNVNGTLFFSADNGTNGAELWKSDGSLANTVLVKDINSSGNSTSTPVNLTNVNGTLFFSANDGTTGTELWKSDGTSANTLLVNDIVAGNGSSTPVSLTNVNGKLFFVATDASHGSELWTLVEGNTAPVLGAIGNKTVGELSTLTFVASAVDTDVPANTLTYSLVNAPVGATINAATGGFTWTPTELQGPGSYSFTVKVVDNGSPQLSDEELITVTVNEINGAPVLTPIGNQSVNELETLTFTASAIDADRPANTLTYSLVNGPVGASINATTGAFSWTPTESQGFGIYAFTVRVTDSGLPQLSDDELITVTVNEVNVAPVLAPIGNKKVDEFATLTFTASATDADLPANTLTYSLVGAPVGATINVATGEFNWTPNETQGPGSYTFTVKVADNGSTQLSDQEEITVTVNEVNVAPVLGAIGNKSVDELTTLTFTATATDGDLPANTLTYSLVGAPDGASIDGTTGVFSWTPTELQGAGSYGFTVQVSDGTSIDGEPITVTVNEVNVAPVVNTAANATIVEATAFIGSGSFSDPDNADTWTATVNYGDGSGAQALALNTDKSFDLSHLYADSGSFAVTVTVTDAVGASAVSVTEVEVANVAPSASLSGPTDGFQGVRGQNRVYVLSASDAAQPDNAAGFTFSVNWGDGSAPETLVGPSGTQAGHIFDAAGTYEIHVTATDKDGGVSAIATQSATILATEIQSGYLSIGGTGDDDLLEVTPSGLNVALVLNGVSLGTVSPPAAGIMFYAGRGNDQVTYNGTAIADQFTAGLNWAERATIRTTGEDVEIWQVNGLDGNDKLVALGGSATFDGGTGTDNVTGPNSTNAWSITGANSGTVNGLAFRNVENLTGGAQADNFSFIGTGALSGRIDGAAGTDSFDYRAANSTAVSVNLTTLTATGTSSIYSIESFFGTTGTDTFTGPSSNNTWNLTGLDLGVVAGTAFSGFEFLTGSTGNDTFTLSNPAVGVSGQIDGGAGNDMVIGAASNSSWLISSLGGGKRIDGQSGVEVVFAGIENLFGNSFTDSFVFGAAGSIAGLVDGKTSYDSLDFSQVVASVTVDLQARTASIVGSFTGIETLTASVGGSDTLIGPNAATAWGITGMNAGTVGSTAFSGFENLTGGTGNDTFTLANTTAGISGRIDGAAGTDTLFGAAVNSSWQISSLGGGKRTDSQSGAELTFMNIESLTGASAADYFSFIGTGALSGRIDGAAGTDIIDYRASSSTAVSVNLTTLTATGTSSIYSIESFFGSAGIDTFTGPSSNNTWNLTGSNTGVVAGTAFSGFENLTGGTGNDTFTQSVPAAGVSGQIDGGTGSDLLIGAASNSSWVISSLGGGKRTDGQTNADLTFVGIENLTGGSQIDTFQFATAGQLSGALNGGSGNNVLSYETWATAVTVNLQTGVATAVTGIVSNITVVLGGSGNDVLTAATARSAVLVGNDGNDTLVGSSLRDLLIGGTGADTLNGGGGDDLLIGGRTAHDHDLNALAAIFAEWSNGTRDYPTRVANLRGTGSGTRLNGNYFLSPSTVLGDAGAVDQLTGGTERDWFFANVEDVVNDQLISGTTEFVDRV